jgi:DEAD/DEAH box helicase domain-containing protein
VGLEAIIQGWKQSPGIAPCIEAAWTRPARPARHGEWPARLHPAILAALARSGPQRPYDHQAEAVEAALAGEPVVVATPTSSGKSLCLHLPVLDSLLRDPSARALYLLPTKALARDQEASLSALAGEVSPGLGAAVFDGDTPRSARRAVRERARIVLTNPDMLHVGILPQHASWSSFLAGLTHVVLDEVHAYRGVFGSHVANVLRRLQRVARYHGASPRFLGASATIADPAGHFGRLCGVEAPVRCVLSSGAPAGDLHALFYNPPVVNSALGVRASALKAADRLATQLLRGGQAVICFCRSRLDVEILLRYLRRSAARIGLPEGAVEGYRGGYLPDARRAVEAGLREGRVRAVVSTNALELGVDIGALDACILVGYPGTVASTWQRAGRAGRRDRPAALVLIGTSDPVDQYVIKNPERVRDGKVEHARCDPNNLLILLDHLRCAAFELPLRPDERFGDAPTEVYGALLEHLVEERSLAKGAGGLRYAGESFPAARVNIRGAPGENFVVIDHSQGERLIAEVDFHGAPLYLHPKAIYSVNGALHHVDHLDWDGRRAYVRRVEPDHFTTAITHKQVTLLAASSVRRLGAAETGVGDVRVAEKVIGYKKVRFGSHENVGYGEVDLPSTDLVTVALWISVPPGLVGLPPGTVIDGLRSLGHALHHAIAVHLMCDARDLGRVVQIPGEQPAPMPPLLYIHDRVPGGVGLAAGAWEELPTLLAMTRRLIEGCGCEGGCPACVGPSGVPGADQGNPASIPPRHSALAVLTALTHPNASTEAHAHERSATT